MAPDLNPGRDASQQTPEEPQGVRRALLTVFVGLSFLVGAGLIFTAAFLLLIDGSGQAPDGRSGPVPPDPGSTTSASNEEELASPALPRQGDLTMGGEAGEVLIGMTLRPGQPGPNEVLVYILPLEGEEEADGIPVTISTGDRSVRATGCGPTCRRAQLKLQGGDSLTIRVGGASGGEDVLQLPELPAPDGSAIFSRVQERMHALQTYRLEETLSSGRATVRADYAFQAPDRMRITVDSGSDRILVGKREWSRKRPKGSWREEVGIKPKVPRFVWDSGGESVAPRILGETRVDGSPATVISFFGGSGTPIWFRLWIDGDGLVHRAEMRAQGHFMDHRYSGFDAPFEIVPPVEGGGDEAAG